MRTSEVIGVVIAIGLQVFLVFFSDSLSTQTVVVGEGLAVSLLVVTLGGILSNEIDEIRETLSEI